MIQLLLRDMVFLLIIKLTPIHMFYQYRLQDFSELA